MPRKKKPEVEVEMVEPEAEAARPVTVVLEASQLARILGVRGFVPKVLPPASVDGHINLLLEPDPESKHQTEFESDRVTVGSTSTLHQLGRTYVSTSFLPVVPDEDSAAAEGA